MSRKIIAESDDTDTLSLSGPVMIELLGAVHEKGAAFRFKATGCSMTPAICSNDVITISPLKGIPPSLGEVAAFRHPQSGRLFIHRVVQKKQGTFFIRGDSLRYIDSYIPPANILGVVTAVERRGRKIFWPDRSRHPLPAKLYFRGYLAGMKIRRSLRAALKSIALLLKKQF